MIRTLLISGLGAAICVSGYPAKGIAAVIATTVGSRDAVEDRKDGMCWGDVIGRHGGNEAAARLRC